MNCLTRRPMYTRGSRQFQEFSKVVHVQNNRNGFADKVSVYDLYDPWTSIDSKQYILKKFPMAAARLRGLILELPGVQDHMRMLTPDFPSITLLSAGHSPDLTTTSAD